jgi:hypothetical protein
MADRTGKARSALSTLLNLAGFGLAAAASIIFCVIAAFSFLYTSEEIPQTSEIRDRSVEVKLLDESFPAAAELLGSGAEATFGDPPRDGPAVPDTPPREASGAQSPSEPAQASASEASAAYEAALSGTASPPPIPADHDRVSRGIQVQDNQTVKLDADDAVSSREEMPRQLIQQGKAHDYYLRKNPAAWKYRLKRECGPIKDRELYDDCFRSFRAQYPTDYSNPMRTYSRRGS